MKNSYGSQTQLGFPAFDPEQNCGTCLLHKVPGNTAHGKQVQVGGCLDP